MIERPIFRKLEVYYASESKKYFGLLSDDEAIAKVIFCIAIVNNTFVVINICFQCSKIIEQEKKILTKFLPKSVDLIIERARIIYVSDNINRVTERAKYYIEHEEFECNMSLVFCRLFLNVFYNVKLL